MNKLGKIILDIEKFIGNPKKFIDQDISQVFFQWKQYLLRTYILSQKNVEYTNVIKSKMLGRINAFFDEIYYLDIEKENARVEKLIEEKGLRDKIEEITDKYLQEEEEEGNARKKGFPKNRAVF